MDQGLGFTTPNDCISCAICPWDGIRQKNTAFLTRVPPTKLLERRQVAQLWRLCCRPSNFMFPSRLQLQRMPNLQQQQSGASKSGHLKTCHVATGQQSNLNVLIPKVHTIVKKQNCIAHILENTLLWYESSPSCGELFDQSSHQPMKTTLGMLQS